MHTRQECLHCEHNQDENVCGQQRQDNKGYQSPDISAERAVPIAVLDWGSIVKEHRAWRRQPMGFVKICLPHGCLLFVPEVQPYLENKYSLKDLF